MKISYYDLLGMVKDGNAPERIEVSLTYGTSRIYEAEYDIGEFNHYRLDEDYLEDENYKDYLSECFLESMMFNKCITILDEEDEFEDIELLDVALLGQCDNWLRCPTNEVTKQDIELNPYIINNIRGNTLEFQHKINDLIKNQKKIIDKLNKE